MGVCIKHDFTPEQIRALADFWPVFANPKFVYETQDEAKERKGVLRGVKVGFRAKEVIPGREPDLDNIENLPEARPAYCC